MEGGPDLKRDSIPLKVLAFRDRGGRGTGLATGPPSNHPTMRVPHPSLFPGEGRESRTPISQFQSTHRTSIGSTAQRTFQASPDRLTRKTPQLPESKRPQPRPPRYYLINIRWRTIEEAIRKRPQLEKPPSSSPSSLPSRHKSLSPSLSEGGP